MIKGDNPKGKETTTGGLTRTIVFPKGLYNSVNEYRTYVFNKTGFKPSLSECIRILIKEALIARNAYESGADEEDSEDERS